MSQCAEIKLSPEEEQTLRRWTAAGTNENRLVERAKVVLLLGQGKTNLEVAQITSPARQAAGRLSFDVPIYQGGAVRNAINPLITMFGFSLAALLSGSFLVEYVFNWPGLAVVTTSAVLSKDEPLVMASVLFAAVLLVAGNVVADILLAVVDPRIRAN